MSGHGGHRIEGSSRSQRICLLGATGTIGRATVRALVARGHEVVCLVRHGADRRDRRMYELREVLSGASVRLASVTDPASLARDGFCNERFDVLVSCMASRTGEPRDAWAVDYQAHVNVLQAARSAGVGHFVLLSAICVQKPRLAFQYAKLAFEKALAESGIAYTIVRPTAFFKSLSGQIERVLRGKPFMVFGDGRLTACKPVSDRDMAEYLADCLEGARYPARILAVGGPGEAITPRQQGEQLFALIGRPPRFQHVPVKLLDATIGVLSAASRIVSAVAVKAELARIGRYYATESMLLWDAERACYDAAATPSTGRDTLFDFYSSVVNSGQLPSLGDHAVF
ncbi:MAG TPA: NAD(P)H-binding protein [Steroidobacteraceae bacterium]|nr:NAD(P)H-binding protein [Steroidobacteraceae bacterium]